jgi:hypothetical protein
MARASISTPTPAQVGGDFSKIDTRVPSDDMHRTDFASVVGKQAVVLLFATRQLCQSRVCGPGTGQGELDEPVEFIHMEIYSDNDPGKDTRSQVGPSTCRPWLFVIDREGMIRTRIEGTFGIDELRAAVEEVVS